MKKLQLISVSLIIVLVAGGWQQQKLSDGAALLFKDIKTILSASEKNSIFAGTGFILSADKKQFLFSDDPSAAAFPFSANVFPTDTNKDGREEVFIVFGNSYTSGETGSNVLLFIKSSAGLYQSNFGFSGTMPMLLPSKNLGYPDLLIGGPGKLFPVWRWNGKEYLHNRNITAEKLTMIQAFTAAEASRIYTSSIR